MKPFSQACENNKTPILSVLEKHLPNAKSVLEIGSGTGQHAVYFAHELPYLHWQPSDLEHNLAGISSWVDEYALPNVKTPIKLNIDQEWPGEKYDAVFTANTFHIVSWQQVRTLIENASSMLKPQGLLIVYGPFNYNGAFTSESNANFQQWLQARDPLSGIRDFEQVNAIAEQANLALIADHAMPANNRTLVWERL